MPALQGDCSRNEMADQIQAANLRGATPKPGRLAYIDWLRGLACVLMFQTHCYNSWLNADARKPGLSGLYGWSQLLGTLPAPLFIFLAGISSALVTQRLREKGVARSAIARTTILRGTEIFGLGLLFRGQEYLLGYPKAPWADLLRVDVLNILGVSMMLLGVLCWLTASATPETSNARAVRWGLAVAAAIAIVTPWLWTTHQPHWLPWPVESYINGVHIYAQPQPWLFPIFPWVAFAFVGLAVGFLLFSEFARTKETVVFGAIGGAGIIASLLSLLFDASPVRLYSLAICDYWHTSPNFFLMRCGVLLALVFLAYAWCRWGFAQRGFSPIIQLGNTSLLVYWVHIEFVYGRFSILPKGQCTILKASAGLLVIFLAMLALSVLRTNWKKRRARAVRATPAPAAATAESG
jgi:uncharacterized membrane protein